MDYPLIKGSKNNLVKDLQTRLNKLGAVLIADEYFGQKTEDALLKYTGKRSVGSQSELNAIGNSVSNNTIAVDYTKIATKVPADVLSSLIEAMKRFDINNILRVSHFVSQCAHESLGFTFKSENLNYSAEGLRKTFAKYFPDDATAKAYARQPEKIANRVYASRYGNGMETSGDGWRFRGKGYAQLTFKDNYVAFGKAIGEDLTVNPELVATPKYASLSACWFFSSKGLNALADTGSTDDVVKQITLKINGGYNGLAERTKNFKEVYALFQQA
jgi:putative chitinase